MKTKKTPKPEEEEEEKEEEETEEEETETETEEEAPKANKKTSKGGSPDGEERFGALESEVESLKTDMEALANEKGTGGIGKRIKEAVGGSAGGKRAAHQKRKEDEGEPERVFRLFPFPHWGKP